MDRQPARPDEQTPAVDDARIGALVRSVAEDWHRPPQRLDRPTWREQVETGRRLGRGSGGRRWFGRLAGAATLAVVATVVLAVTAVYLSNPHPDRGIVGASPTTGASPSTGRSPSPAAASPLPALVLNGAVPSVTNVLLQGDSGYRFVDLATGTLGPALPWGVGGSNTVLARPGGGWVCVCVAYHGGSGGSPTSLTVALEAIDASGEPAGHADLPRVSSELKTPATSTYASQVDVHADLSPDAQFAYIGQSHATASGWRAAIDVVDLTTLKIVHSVAVPDVNHAAEAGERAWVELAPKVSMRLDGKVYLISSDWYVDDPTTSSPAYGTDRWSATFDGEAPLSISSAGEQSHSCGAFDQGLIDDSSYYVACITPAGMVRVDRYRLDGTVIDRNEVGRSTGFGVMPVRSGSRLFLWDVQEHTLVRIDLTTGFSDRLAAGTGSLDAPTDVVAALGRAIGHWIAPTVAAKMLLHPALALSPDGKILYALGIDGSIESARPSGVFAFDVSGDSLALRGHWTPTADFVSIAVSADGGFVYAAGMGGADATGSEAPGVKPSVTVFDAADGSVRLIAGQLSGSEFLFVEPIVR